MMKMIILENIKNSSNMSRNSIEGYSTILKVIEESDSQLICDLRNNPNINKFLSNSTSITVLEQKEWLKNNLKANDGIYFKIIDKNKIILSEQFLCIMSIIQRLNLGDIFV